MREWRWRVRSQSQDVDSRGLHRNCECRWIRDASAGEQMQSSTRTISTRPESAVDETLNHPPNAISNRL